MIGTATAAFSGFSTATCPPRLARRAGLDGQLVARDVSSFRRVEPLGFPEGQPELLLTPYLRAARL